MLTMAMTSLNVPPPLTKLQQHLEPERNCIYKSRGKNRPPTCSLDLLDDDEQVNTMVKYATTHCPTIDEEDEKNNWLIHLETLKTHVLTQLIHPTITAAIRMISPSSNRSHPHVPVFRPRTVNHRRVLQTGHPTVCKLLHLRRVSEVTLRFWGVTTSVVGANSLLFGWIRLDVKLNRDFSYSSCKGFLTTGPQIDTGNVVTHMILVMELCRGETRSSKTSYVLGFELRRSAVSFIYGVAYLIDTVSFGITRLICASDGITRLICASFEITGLICASFGITRLICASFGITRLICVSFGITRLICASFRITRLICASDGITRLIDVMVWRGADRRGTRRVHEGHMDASSFFMLPLTMAVPSDKYFPATVSYQVHKISGLIKDKLTKEELQMFNKTIFGPLLNVNMFYDPSFLAEVDT
ncbi:Ulp1-like peptidase [Cucumis melo var. makuwa]|uniref:Ulp1-like peptidase n=1 Tax=Cucumis melo var. makuwa TaxID=1194695 RepID=A0A5A7UK32_CUCMM|nr:Ulp1-like peptidase [Cucumis melo var. makuwa]